MSFHTMLNIHPEVARAIREHQPVVALESTIISHGMPWPENAQTARDVEAIIRSQGAVPATIAVLDGKCCVGLDESQLERLGNQAGVWKVSLRDLPFVMATQKTGGTTVASTMRIASMAGIPVFVTGGIGGVHRGAQETFDISADLQEMAKTSVAIVSAGVKSILDVGLTLEYLETMGVPVIGFGQKAFPSFYSRESGYSSPLQLHDADEVAALMHSKWKFHLEGAVLIANPVPKENEIPHAEMELVIQEALVEAEKNKIQGKEITPFLLKNIAERTGGNSLATNIALIKHNAQLGAKIAVAYAALKED